MESVSSTPKAVQSVVQQNDDRHLQAPDVEIESNHHEGWSATDYDTDLGWSGEISKLATSAIAPLIARARRARITPKSGRISSRNLL